MKAKDSARQCEPATDQEAQRLLEEAFAQYQSELLGTLYHLVGNLEDARDALQETFIKCWRHRSEIEELRSLKAWIFQIALNTGRDVRSTAWRRRRRPITAANPGGEEVLVSHDPGPEVDAVRHERLDRLRKAVTELRPEEKEVFLLRQNGEMTYEEISRAAGIPLGTVKTRMRRALSCLRTVLTED